MPLCCASPHFAYLFLLILKAVKPKNHYFFDLTTTQQFLQSSFIFLPFSPLFNINYRMGALCYAKFTSFTLKAIYIAVLADSEILILS